MINRLSFALVAFLLLAVCQGTPAHAADPYDTQCLSLAKRGTSSLATCEMLIGNPPPKQRAIEARKRYEKARANICRKADLKPGPACNSYVSALVRLIVGQAVKRDRAKRQRAARARELARKIVTERKKEIAEERARDVRRRIGRALMLFSYFGSRSTPLLEPPQLAPMGEPAPVYVLPQSSLSQGVNDWIRLNRR